MFLYLYYNKTFQSEFNNIFRKSLKINNNEVVSYFNKFLLNSRGKINIKNYTNLEIIIFYIIVVKKKKTKFCIYLRAFL